jgi:hypothetical protein
VNEAGLRRAGRRALDGVVSLAGWVFAVLWVAARFWPKTVPDLKRLTRRDDFRSFESAAAAWLDQHFWQIEEGAPWLDRAGRLVSDGCATSLGSAPLSFRWEPTSVVCSREVTTVYGADGSLGGRLTELRRALHGAGWTYVEDHPVSRLPLYRSLMWPFRWSPVEVLGLPAGLETIPPDRQQTVTGRLDMGVGWVSRGEPDDLRTYTQPSGPPDPRVASATYQPVDVSGSEVARLASQALARHQHAIAVRIKMVYYTNYNVNADPHRLRKRLFPLPPWG